MENARGLRCALEGALRQPDSHNEWTDERGPVRNPDHTEQGAQSIERFAEAVSGSLANAPALERS